MKEKRSFEFRRQTAHILFGVLILWGMHFALFDAVLLGIFTIVCGVLLFLIKKGVQVPVLYNLLQFFERPEHFEHFPGRGLFFFLLGAFLSNLLFPENIATASLAILLVGDAITNIAGHHLGKTKNPLNHDKTIEGTIAGILSSWMVCVLFFPAFPSFITALVAMIVEIPKISIKGIPIDDNVTIPLSAGAILYLFSLGMS